MGKKLKKATSIKIDKNTGKNLIKNAAPVFGIAKSIGLTNGNLIDDMFGKKGGGGGGGEAAEDPLQKKANEYEAMLADARIKNLQSQDRFTQDLEKQARGEGPSLATAQLKAAQSRNLAQTLAAAQTAGAGPLSTRQLLQQRGQSSRDIAELGGIQRMQEQQAAQQQLGQQLGQQANTSQGFATTGFGIAKSPIESNIQTQQFQQQLQQQKDLAFKQRQAQMAGALIGAGGSAAMLSDENQKQPPKRKMLQDYADTAPDASAKNPYKDGVDALTEGLRKALSARKSAGDFKETNAPVQQRSPDLVSDENQKQPAKLPSAKKEINSFLDQLAARKYEYKDPSMPGAAEGERVGIVAQDLERSSLGKTLVKDTPNGKMVDTVQGFGTVLAAQAELNRRLKKIEKKG